MSVAAPDRVIGVQRPRVSALPAFSTSAGREAVDLAETAGLVLDPWQRFVLEHALGEKENGRWSAFEVAVIVSRQNGKGALLEARELFGLFLGGEQLILHSAHEFKTAQEAFRRVLALVENTDALRKRVARVRTSHGEEGIELVTGQRLRFIARSRGSGRGFTGDCVILDEAMILGDEAMAALLPTMSARPNPQLWYTASAGDHNSTQLGRVRRRGVKGDDPALAFFEWSASGVADHDDPATWADTNPGLGIRMTVEHIARERAAMGPTEFARERLGIGTYPVDGEGWAVIPADVWATLSDPESRRDGRVAFAVDMTPERSHVAVGVAGRRDDGRLHVEIVDHRAGAAWVVDRVVELLDRWDPVAVVIDPSSPAGSLIAPLTAAGVELVTPNAREVGQACGQFYDAVTEPADLVHIDQAPLNHALAGALKRTLGDAWAWDRRNVGVDICPLVAVTLAAWGLATRAHLDPPYNVLESIW